MYAKDLKDMDSFQERKVWDNLFCHQYGFVFSESKTESFIRKFLIAMNLNNAEYNLYYYFLHVTIYYIAHCCPYSDHKLESIIKIARCVNKDRNDILLSSTFDIMIYTAEHTSQDNLISIREYHAAFNQYFYIVYRDLDSFVSKLEKELKAYEDMIIDKTSH